MANPHDNEILNHIFNPLLPTSASDILFQLPESEEQVEEILELDSIEYKTFKELELEGVKAAESGKLHLALDLFTQTITIAPESHVASGYNNRAQTFRLLGRIDEAREDLNNAINLSEGKGRAGCQAYCQRGLIYMKENQSEYAKKDFEKAAQLGSQFAKAQLVQLNPYAALCNKMLREMFVKYRNGEAGDNEETGTNNDYCNEVEYKYKD